MKLSIVIFGLSITSSWGNGHATTYRALIKALHRRGHRVTFLERDAPWYSAHRDLPEPPYCKTELYSDLRDVPRRYGNLVRDADLVIIGSFVPDAIALGEWITTKASGITAFYDIDTPVTLAGLSKGGTNYLHSSMIPRFDIYLSFTGGPTLDVIEQRFGSPCARPLYCSVDPDLHMPRDVEQRWALGYLGTYSADRQPGLTQLLIEPARELPRERFIVAGAQYPSDILWPDNVSRIEHLPPQDHSAFYSAQRYTLNLTRTDMIAAGYCPSVRLFEAAAAGVPIISDNWPGLETFFASSREILLADGPHAVLEILQELPEERRRTVADAARKRVLANHTAEHRARQLEDYVIEAYERQRGYRGLRANAFGSVA
jgi:spore maturation protein CgeB